MTARGFGKRNLPVQETTWESRLLEKLLSYTDNKRANVGEPKLRFRMDDDAGLRIGRGFGKRSDDGQKEEYTRPWSSPSIRELNDVEKVLRTALETVENESKEIS